jgi:hypothetical protein
MKVTDRQRGALDALIDFQERHGNVDSEIPIHVALSPSVVGRLIGQVPATGSRQFEYRGRTIICTAADPVGERFLGGKP